MGNLLGKLTACRLSEQQAVAAIPWDIKYRTCSAYTHAFLKLGQAQQAKEHFEQELQIEPDYAAAHHTLGSLLFDQGRVPEAMGHWEKALQINPMLAEVHCNLGIALEQVGLVEEAIEHYEQAVLLRPDLIEIQKRLDLLRATGRSMTKV